MSNRHPHFTHLTQVLTEPRAMGFISSLVIQQALRKVGYSSFANEKLIFTNDAQTNNKTPGGTEFTFGCLSLTELYEN
jgi:hypothetical protein